MAMDQALASCAEACGRPTMRLYQWTPFCISLGYHQSPDVLDLDLCREHGMDVVRRPTGGRAVFHSEEWTYAVVLPAPWPGMDTLASAYRQIGAGLVRGLSFLDLPAKLEKRPLDLHAHYQSELASSCFSAAAKYEVVADGRKLVGSAQRKVAGSLLQHGSILTGRMHARLPHYFKGADPDKRARMSRILAGKSACVQDFLQDRPVLEEAAGIFRKGMEAALGVRMEEGGLSDAERSMIADLRPGFSILENKPGPALTEPSVHTPCFSGRRFLECRPERKKA